MHGTFPNKRSMQASELNSALRTCLSAFGACTLFSFVINILMLASPIYMLQVYDRVLTTGHVDTLIMITLVTTIALAVMCALDTLRTVITIRIGCWLSDRTWSHLSRMWRPRPAQGRCLWRAIISGYQPDSKLHRYTRTDRIPGLPLGSLVCRIDLDAAPVARPRRSFVCSGSFRS